MYTFPRFFGIFPRFSTGFCNFPGLFYMVTQFWAQIYIARWILNRLKWFAYFCKIFFRFSIVEETQNEKNRVKKPVLGNLRYNTALSLFGGIEVKNVSDIYLCIFKIPYPIMYNFPRNSNLLSELGSWSYFD